MTLDNGRGRVFQVKWASVLPECGYLMACITDDKESLSELCAACTGVECWTRKDEREGDAVYEGYVDLLSVRKDGRDTIITLCRDD